MLDFINSNIGLLTIIFSGVVAISTVVYAILTAHLVSETKKLRKIQIEPEIAVYILPRKEWINFIDIIIENIGQGPAYNIKFHFDKSLKVLKDKDIKRINILNKGIHYMAPKQKINFFITSMIENFEEKSKLVINVIVKYKSLNNKNYESKYILDFSQFLGVIQLGEPPLYKISKNIEAIKKDIHSLSTGFHKLKVYTYNSKDRSNEKKEIDELYQQQKKKTKSKKEK